jgi:hypothetical protein
MGTPTPITVTGTIVNRDGPVSGKLVFASSTLVRDNASDDVMLPQEIVVTVPGTGEFTVVLPATDDPGFSPTGWTWEVRPHFLGWKTPFSISVPYDAAEGEIEFSALVEVPPDGTGELYALAGHTHPGGGEGGPIAISDVTGLTAALAGKQAVGSYAASVHTHVTADVTGLSAALAAKADDTDITALDTRVDALEAVGPTIYSWNGSAYVADSDARIYVGPSDPGAVADGSIWVEVA